MSQSDPPNLFDTYDAEGLYHDVADIISNISPIDTPILSMIGSRDTRSTLHQWQLDTLAAPEGTQDGSGDPTNAHKEGGDAILAEAQKTSMVQDYLQISKKDYGVSGTLEVADKYGRGSELDYQSAKKARELKKDVDFAISGANQASFAGVADGIRLAGSLESWISTNFISLAATTAGVAAGYDSATGLTVARTAGTGGTGPFTQDSLDSVIESCFQNGAEPTYIVLGPRQKRVFSKFDGVGGAVGAAYAGATRSDRASGTIFGGMDYYVSNHGTLEAVVSRHLFLTDDGVGNYVDSTLFVIDPEYLHIGYLRPWQEFDLAKIGDQFKREMLVEWTLIVDNEAAHGMIAEASHDG